MTGHARFVRATTLLTLFTVVGCDDPAAPADEAPELPPAESMIFDFGFFDGGGAARIATPDGISRQGGAGLNWAAGALSVGLANLSVVAHLAVPVTTWRAAAAHAPVFEGDAWRWSYSVTQGADSYSADLTGFRDGDDRVFEMVINSSALQLTDFLWYRGRAPVGGTQGTWDFFDPDVPSTVSGRIDWSHPANDQWILTFSAQAGDNVGDRLEYETDGVDRFVTFIDASESRTYEVYWNAVTREGHIVSPGFRDGAMACWDTSLQDTPCT